jgi:hypothetical protein
VDEWGKAIDAPVIHRVPTGGARVTGGFVLSATAGRHWRKRRSAQAKAVLEIIVIRDIK